MAGAGKRGIFFKLVTTLISGCCTLFMIGLRRFSDASQWMGRTFDQVAPLDRFRGSSVSFSFDLSVKKVPSAIGSAKP